MHPNNVLFTALCLVCCVAFCHTDPIINVQEIYSFYPDTVMVFGELEYDTISQNSYYSQVQNFTAIPQWNEKWGVNAVPNNINVNTIYSTYSSKIHISYYYNWDNADQHLVWTFDTNTKSGSNQNITNPNASEYTPLDVSLSNYKQEYPLYFVISSTSSNTLNITVWDGKNNLNFITSLNETYKSFTSNFLVKEDEQSFFLTNAESEIFGTTSLLVGNFSSGALYTVPLISPNYHLIQIWDLVDIGNTSLLGVFSTSEAICSKPSESMLLFLGTIDIESGSITQITNFGYYSKLPCKGFLGNIYTTFDPANYTISVLAPVGNIYLFWQVDLTSLHTNYRAINIPNNNPVNNYFFMWNVIDDSDTK